MSKRGENMWLDKRRLCHQQDKIHNDRGPAWVSQNMFPDEGRTRPKTKKTESYRYL